MELWNEDEAGPYQAIPQPGEDWHPVGKPRLLPHEYQRGGTAKLLTLFRPATGLVRAKGVLSAPNVVLHPWLKEQFLQELGEIEKKHPAEALPPEAERPLYARWETWLGQPLRRPWPPLRIIVIWDNLAGHLTDELVDWLFDHGILPLYTPLSGSWLNMAESVQRIIVRRALSGQHPKTARACHRLARANGRRVECRSHAFRVEWQAPSSSGACPSAPTRWVGSCCLAWLFNC